VAQAVEEAYRAGIVPVVAAGNEGPRPRTIGTPGIDPLALTVGALDTMKTADRGDDDIPPFSSRGPTRYDKLDKPDIVFPGVDMTAPLSPGSVFDESGDYDHVGNEYLIVSGTSMAAPGVAGVVADLIQANPDLTPEDIKNVLTGSAVSVAVYLSSIQQGKGAPDAEKALEMALKLHHG
jgi:serine protease AprX